MKDISSAAGLSRVYTNHSVRATAVTLWSTAGLTKREIMAISGHRNESSLKSYHSMPSANQLRKCSDVLASALGDNETIRAAEQRQNQIVGCERPPLQQLPVPLNNTISATQQNTVNTSSASAKCSILARLETCTSLSIDERMITFLSPELNFRKHFTFHRILLRISLLKLICKFPGTFSG